MVGQSSSVYRWAAVIVMASFVAYSSVYTRPHYNPEYPTTDWQTPVSYMGKRRHESEDNIHIMVLAMGKDSPKADAFDFARIAMMASGIEDSLTFHFFSDTWPQTEEASSCGSKANRILRPVVRHHFRCHTIPHSFSDSPTLAEVGFNETDWESHFKFKPDFYHNRTLLLWKIVSPLLLPDSVKRVVLFDSDIFVQSSLSSLWKVFDSFRPQQAYAMTLEQAPAYADCFREEAEAAIASNGIPIWPNYGFPGFNSGVILIHVDRLRKSREFLNLLRNPDKVFDRFGAMRANDEEIKISAQIHRDYFDLKQRVEKEIRSSHAALGGKSLNELIDKTLKNEFQKNTSHSKRHTNDCSIHGILGDQDVLNAAVTMYPWLFGSLPCEWNKALCRFHMRNSKFLFATSHASNWSASLFQCRTKDWHALHGNCDVKPWNSPFNVVLHHHDICNAHRSSWTTGEKNKEEITLDPQRLQMCKLHSESDAINRATNEAKSFAISSCNSLCSHAVDVSQADLSLVDESCASWNCSCQGLSERFNTFPGFWGDAGRYGSAKHFWGVNGCNTSSMKFKLRMCSIKSCN